MCSSSTQISPFSRFDRKKEILQLEEKGASQIIKFLLSGCGRLREKRSPGAVMTHFGILLIFTFFFKLGLSSDYVTSFEIISQVFLSENDWKFIQRFLGLQLYGFFNSLL